MKRRFIEKGGDPLTILKKVHLQVGLLQELFFAAKLQQGKLKKLGHSWKGDQIILYALSPLANSVKMCETKIKTPPPKITLRTDLEKT